MRPNMPLLHLAKDFIRTIGVTDESMTGFIRATKNIETLQSDDIANAILYAIQAPNHVNANEILIRSIAQERY